VAILLAALAALVLADRAGVFGHGGDDLARYDDKVFRVSGNIDGDTLDVDLADRRNGYRTTRIRLWGVDTPETRRPNTPVQHFGPEASAFTKGLTANKRIHLRLLPEKTRDSYGRLLAYVTLPDGRMLNRLLVSNGYAYADPRFPHPLRTEFAAAMKRARKARLGLWAQAAPVDLPAYLLSAGSQGGFNEP